MKKKILTIEEHNRLGHAVCDCPIVVKSVVKSPSFLFYKNKLQNKPYLMSIKAFCILNRGELWDLKVFSTRKEAKVVLKEYLKNGWGQKPVSEYRVSVCELSWLK